MKNIINDEFLSIVKANKNNDGEMKCDIFESCKYGKVEKDQIFLHDEGYFDELSYRTCVLGNCPHDCLLCTDYSKKDQS